MEKNKFKPTSLLDVACGTGNNSILFSKQGLTVSGIDFSEEMLIQAKKKTRELRLPIKFYKQSFLNLKLNQTFDSAICLDFSTNHLLNEKEFLKFLENIYYHLKTGGIFVFDYKPLKDFKRKFNYNSPKKIGDWEYFFKPKYKLPFATLFFYLQNNLGKKYCSKSLNRFFSLHELKEIILKSNFNLIDIYEDYSFNKPSKNSKFWFFVLRK